MNKLVQCLIGEDQETSFTTTEVAAVIFGPPFNSKRFGTADVRWLVDTKPTLWGVELDINVRSVAIKAATDGWSLSWNALSADSDWKIQVRSHDKRLPFALYPTRVTVSTAEKVITIQF